MNLSQMSANSMARLQDELNTIIDPNWINAGFAWHRAAWIECAELTDHIGWKWWKQQEPNFVQARIELVDIWHFLLSDYLTRYGKGAPEAIEREVNDPEAKVYLYAGNIRGVDSMTLLQQVDTFASLVAGGTFNASLFNEIRQSLGMTWGELERMYVAKNVLNIFRQRNGDKQGRYLRLWNGREDNAFLEEILDGNPDITTSGIFALLDREYTRVITEAVQ